MFLGVKLLSVMLRLLTESECMCILVCFEMSVVRRIEEIQISAQVRASASAEWECCFVAPVQCCEF